MSKRKKNSFNMKRNIVIVLIAVIVVLGAIILLFFNKNTVPGEHFSEKKYYVIDKTGTGLGGGTSYMFFNVNGEFEYFTSVMFSPRGSVGHYKIEEDEVYMTEEYGYLVCDKSLVGYIGGSDLIVLKIDNKSLNYTDLDNYVFKEISVSEYKEARNKWGKTYSEAKRIYKTNPGLWPNICD